MSFLNGALDGLPVRVVDVSGVWPSLNIGNVISLGRLEWVWNSRGAPIRDSSQSAKARFELTDSPLLSEPIGPHLAHQWFRRAYVHIFLIPIAELETNKESTSWVRIRHFVDSCREKSLEYLVIVVADESWARMQKKLFDRLRAEVNAASRGRERVVTVPPATSVDPKPPISHLHYSQVHQDLLIRLRECVRDGVETRVQLYETEVMRSYSNRSNANWSFQFHFLVKEAMGFVFCQLGRRDLTLRLLDEVYLTLLEYISSKPHRGERFCNESACDAAANIFDLSSKDYQNLFLDQNITEMEMRTYLFARQANLLLADRKFMELAERGLKLITAIARRCAEETSTAGSNISALFRDAWVFSASRNLATALAPAIPSSPLETGSISPQLPSSKDRHTARLIAGFHVHSLKALQGLGHVILPGTLAPVSDLDKKMPSESASAFLESCNEELCEALSTSAKAESIYSEIANSAASLYEMGARARGAAALDGDAGMIRIRNENLTEAEKLLSAQCARYDEDCNWDELHSRKRLELAHIEKKLERVQEYLVSCLTMLLMTKTSRKLSTLSLTTGNNGNDVMEDAQFWVEEVARTAAKLPRVMKYKAEKLFHVSAPLNSDVWNEGEKGTSVLVIHSDLPCAIQIDSITMELTNATHSEIVKEAPSALRESDGPSASSHSESQSLKTSPTSKILTLKSKGSVLVESGVTEILLHCPEVPWSGRYFVNLVALFIGNLKLVQTVQKQASSVSVSKKADGRNEPAMQKAMSNAPHFEFGQSAVRFPCYFAKPRPPSAMLKVEQENPLYAADSCTQYVFVTIKSENAGIKAGASLKLTLSSCKESKTSKNCRLQFKESPLLFSLEANKKFESSEEKSSVQFQYECETNHHVEVTINTDIPAGTSVKCRLGMFSTAGCASIFNKKSSSQQERDSSCSLSSLLYYQELTGPENRTSYCDYDHRLVLIEPVAVRTHIERTITGDACALESSHDVGDLSSATGGSIFCTVKSCVEEGKSVCLQSASIVLPSWLQKAHLEVQSHDDLLPCILHNKGEFSLVFDVLTSVDGNEKADPQLSPSSLQNLNQSLSHRRFIRRSKDFQGSKDFRETSADVEDTPLSGDETKVREHNGHIGETPISPASPQELESGNPALMNEHRTDVESPHGLKSALLRDASSTGEQSPQNEEDVYPDLKLADGVEAGDLVDLSGSLRVSDQNTGAISLSSPLPQEQSLATLSLELTIDGVSGSTRLDHVFSVQELQGYGGRYCVERRTLESATTGEYTPFAFVVTELKPTSFLDEHTDGTDELEYEIDANTAHWAVCGQKRGKLLISNSVSDICISGLIPLAAGDILVPNIRLSRKNGRDLPLSSFQNIDAFMQVTVLPWPSVTSASIPTVRRISHAQPAEGKLRTAREVATPRGPMPAVIASDSFFDS